MTTFSAAAPIRCGIAGAGPQGLFHLARLSLHESFQPLCVYDPAETLLRSVEGRIPHTCSDERGLVEDPGIELVFLTAQVPDRSRLACALLTAGKHVVLDAPLGRDLPEANAIFAAARESGRTLAVLPPRRWDGEFRTALAVVQSGTLGRLRSARHISRQFAVPVPLSASAGSVEQPTCAGEEDVLSRFGPHDVDQLLQIAGAPMRVYCRQDSAISSGENGAVGEYQLLFEFEGGATAHLERSLSSRAPLQTGWILEGEQGGYTHSRCYRATADGELVETPVEPQATDPDAFYVGLAQHLRHAAPLPASVEEARLVTAVLEAARESARRGEWREIGL